MSIQNRYFKLLLLSVFFVYSGFSGSLLSQVTNSDSLIHLKGYVLNAESNKPVKGRITYEKLPYGDDFGIANSDSSGAYQMILINKNKYYINIKAPGYFIYKEELEIKNKAGVTTLSRNFYLIPTAVGQVLRIKNLYFEQSTSTISKQDYKELNSIVQMLVENPTMVIQLEGHTDFRGSSKLNYKLAEERVESIKIYMLAKGIDKKRIKLKAYGGSQPLSTESSEEARKLNRRVEVRILQL